MSSSSLGPVGVSGTNTGDQVIRGTWSGTLANAAMTTTESYLLGSANTTTTGMYIHSARTMTRCSVSGNCSATVGNPTVTVTVYKNSVAAGNICFAAVSAATALNTGIDWTTTTVANSGKDGFVAGDKFIVTYKSAATSCTLTSLQVMIDWTFTA